MTFSAEGLVLSPSGAIELFQKLDRIEKMLSAREERAIPERPMSPAEVAKIVGKSQRTVLRWLDSGKLRSKHEGKVRLVRPVDLQRFLEPKGERK